MKLIMIYDYANLIKYSTITFQLVIDIVCMLWNAWQDLLLNVYIHVCSALTRVVSMRETDVGKYRNRYRRRAHRHAFRPAVSAPQLGGEPPISEEVHLK